MIIQASAFKSFNDKLNKLIWNQNIPYLNIKLENLIVVGTEPKKYIEWILDDKSSEYLFALCDIASDILLEELKLFIINNPDNEYIIEGPNHKLYGRLLSHILNMTVDKFNIQKNIKFILHSEFINDEKLLLEYNNKKDILINMSSLKLKTADIIINIFNDFYSIK